MYQTKEAKEAVIEEIKSAKNQESLVPERFSPKNEYQVKRWQFLDEKHVYDTDMLGIGEPRIGLSGEYKQQMQNLKAFINFSEQTNITGPVLAIIAVAHP